MKNDINSVIANELDGLEPSNQQVMMMGSILVGLNLFLMVSVGLYWTNPSFHQYLSGKPL